MGHPKPKFKKNWPNLYDKTSWFEEKLETSQVETKLVRSKVKMTTTKRRLRRVYTELRSRRVDQTKGRVKSISIKDQVDMFGSRVKSSKAQVEC